MSLRAARRPAARRGVHGAILATGRMGPPEVDGARAVLADADGGPARAVLTACDHDLVRIEVLPTGRHAHPRTWAVVGDDGDVPREGRDRDDLARFPAPAWRATPDAAGATLRTDAVTVRVDREPLALTIARPDGTVLWRDLPDGAHGHLPGRGATLHWRRDDDEVIYGLGEAAGPLDRSRRRFRLRPLDALGYDAETGDPLYKHLPVVITVRPDGSASALLIDTAAEVEVDLGAEVDNYHGPYRALRVHQESLDAWFLAGPDLPSLARRIHDLTGRPSVPPRWTLGYLASTMAYTDAEAPKAAFEGFVAALDRHDVPCSGFHLSSGYSMADDGRRYVFAWNRRRVPDPGAAIDAFARRGIRTIANLKPALLTTHPDFGDLARRGLLVREADDDAPYLSAFWGGEGGYLDLTHPDAYAWWMDRVRERILAYGIDATWNDNNEFQIWDDDARAHAGAAGDLRPVLTQAMNRASRDAQRAHRPEARDWQLTRSGMLGTWRYAQTWTGDNRTDWKTLRFNVPTGLNLSLSGWSSFGHDVGGFAGPLPGPELLLRWVEHGVAMPRFSVHSWNDDGSATEPWSHPEILPRVRALLRLRERMVPYLYTLARRAASHAEPIVRPLAYDHPTWRPGHREDLVHMLGPALLIAPVVRPGARTRAVRLPPGRWLELATGRAHDGDVEVAAHAPPGTPAWFLREGRALPIVAPVHEAPDAGVTASDLVRGGAPWGDGGGARWLAFPDRDGRARGALEWDDGITRAHERGAVDRYALTVDGDRARVAAHDGATGMGAPEVEVLVPGDGTARVPMWPGPWRALPVEVARARRG